MDLPNRNEKKRKRLVDLVDPAIPIVTVTVEECKSGGIALPVADLDKVRTDLLRILKNLKAPGRVVKKAPIPLIKLAAEIKKAEEQVK